MAMTLKEMNDFIRALGLYVGDQVKVTNWIHKRIHIEIIEGTFREGDTSFVKVVPTGEIWGVGKAELMEWLTQSDTEIIRLGTETPIEGIQ